MGDEVVKPVLDAAAARALSRKDPDKAVKDALDVIESSAAKGWGSVRLNGPGWREGGESGDILRARMSALGYGVTFSAVERCTHVTW